jgi:hypothetical protein
MATPIKPTDPVNQQTTATALGTAYNDAEKNLLTAYNLTEANKTDSPAQKAKMDALIKALGLTGTDASTASVRSLQLIAEQRYQRASQTITLFSGLMDKVDQLKQRIISKFAN